MFGIKRNPDVEFTAWKSCSLPDPHRCNKAPLCGEERKKGGLLQVCSRSLWGTCLAPDPDMCTHPQNLPHTCKGMWDAYTFSCRCSLSPAPCRSYPALTRASTEGLEARHESEPAGQDDWGKLFRVKEYWSGSTALRHQGVQHWDMAGMGIVDAAWEEPEAERGSESMPLISFPLRSCGWCLGVQRGEGLCWSTPSPKLPWAPERVNFICVLLPSESPI